MRLRHLATAGALTAAALATATGAAAAPPAAGPTHPDEPRSVEEIHASVLEHGPDAELLVAAHRGQWREYPENSIAAIEEAVADGAEIVEIDIQRTADGHLVLMHDNTVDRTTNGTGRVSDLTLAQIKSLRLVEGLGGAAAEVTEHTVPTLEEAMLAVKGRAMVNLDKGWPNRDAMYDVLVATDTVDHALFKGSPTVEEAAAFMAAHEDILYMHIVGDTTANQIGAFPDRQPVAYEVTFDSLDDPQVQPAALAEIAGSSRLWINTMWGSLAADHTDEGTLRGDERSWDVLVKDLGASMLQTDNVEAMDYWRDGGPLHLYDRQPGSHTVRIQAEEPVAGGEGVAYHDTDANNCATVSPDQPALDVCDQRGARVLGYIRGGEWVRYSVDVPRTGTYDVSARVSSPYSPAGTVVMEWDGQPGQPYSVQNTTSHNAFERQDVETRELEAGTHELVVRMPEDAYQNFNIDYFQLDLVSPALR